VTTRAVAAGQSQSSLIQAALPYLRDLDQRKVDAVLRGFQQLEVLQHEGIVLMTPEILLLDGVK